MCFVTVIMSVYNSEQYLKYSIESILNQTFSDFEFIIINDGSTDKSFEIIKNYSDQRIKIISHSNIGLTKSLNKAIKKSKGEFIARMDADDISLPDRLKKQVEYLISNPEIAVLGSSYYEINDKGNIIGKIILPTEFSVIKKNLIRFNSIFHASVIVRKDVLKKVGCYNNDFLYSQDYDLWLKIVKNYRISNIPDTLMMRRYHPNSIGSKNKLMQKYFSIKAQYNAIFKYHSYPLWNLIYLFRPLASMFFSNSMRNILSFMPSPFEKYKKD